MGCGGSKSVDTANQGGAGRSSKLGGRRKRDSIAYNKQAMKKRSDNADGSEHAPTGMVTVIDK